MKSISLYNQDGSLNSEAQQLLSSRPDDVSRTEWRKRLKNFRVQLSTEDLKEFERLRRKIIDTKRYYKKPKKIRALDRAKYYAENHKRLREDNKKWRAKRKRPPTKNTEARRVYMNNYHKRRKAKDPLYRLHCNMVSMGNRVVRQLALGKKPARTEKWQGCTAEELKAHLESLFLEGMTWENYGEWHVDHIRPVSSFASEEWEQINHYTNLQPLWAKDNLSKGNSWEQ